VEPGLLEGDARCPPTSSWWALETPVTLARSGSGRRPSGGHGGGGGAIGGEIALQPPPPVFLNTPDLTGEFRVGFGAGGRWFDCPGQRGGVVSRAAGRRLQIVQVRIRVLRPPWCQGTDPDRRGGIGPGVVEEEVQSGCCCCIGSARASGGCLAIGVEIAKQPPLPVSLDAKPRSHGSEFGTGGHIESRPGAGEYCRARRRPSARGRGEAADTRHRAGGAFSTGGGSGDRRLIGFCRRDPHRPPDPGSTAYNARPRDP
jgi:hypothetical protein